MAPDAAPRRSRSLPGWGTAGVVVALVLIGFLFVANARLAGPGAGREIQDLASLVALESERTQALAEEVEALREEVEALTDQFTDGGRQLLADPNRELTRFESGSVPVTGPGLTVRLTDAPVNAPRPSWATNDDLVIHQQDLQAVINALWAGGAEAMLLQDQRVVATSAFRCVGNVLLLHGRTYSPPYVVRAIGDPAELEAALYRSPAIQKYLEYVDAVGLGWSVGSETELYLPAYEGGQELRHARPISPQPATLDG